VYVLAGQKLAGKPKVVTVQAMKLYGEGCVAPLTLQLDPSFRRVKVTVKRRIFKLKMPFNILTHW
jgi:hypothetical protein